MEISPTTSFTDEEHAQELLQEFVEDGHDLDEMKEFIETHGHKAFYDNYEDYVKVVDQYDQETVDAFLEDFDIDDITRLEDAYYGCFDSEEEFTENFVSECYGLPVDMPTWIKIDWKETWEDGLSWDYTFVNGYVFCNHW